MTVPRAAVPLGEASQGQPLWLPQGGHKGRPYDVTTAERDAAAPVAFYRIFEPVIRATYRREPSQRGGHFEKRDRAYEKSEERQHRKDNLFLRYPLAGPCGVSVGARSR